MTTEDQTAEIKLLKEQVEFEKSSARCWETILNGEREHRDEVVQQMLEAKKLLIEATSFVTCPMRFSEWNREALYGDCGDCWFCRVQNFLYPPGD